MTVDLDYRLPRVTARLAHYRKQNLIENGIGSRVANPTVVEGMRLKPAFGSIISAKDSAADLLGIRPTDTHNGNAAFAGGSSDSSNRILFVHKNRKAS